MPKKPLPHVLLRPHKCSTTASNANRPSVTSAQADASIIQMFQSAVMLALPGISWEIMREWEKKGEKMWEHLGKLVPTRGARLSFRAHLSVRIEFKMFRPEPSNEKPIELRRENQVVISVLIITEPDKANIPWKYIRVLNIGPAGHYRFRCGPASLDFALEVHGATTGRAFVSACNKCSAKDPPASCNLSLLDFTAKNGLVGITSGTARVAFRFRCLPRHHNTSDTEYR